MNTPDAILRDWFESVWVRGDESAIDRLMDPEAVVHGLGDTPIRGPAGFKPHFHSLRGALGGMQIRLSDFIVQDDCVAAIVYVAATHVGDSLGVRATSFLDT